MSADHALSQNFAPNWLPYLAPTGEPLPDLEFDVECGICKEKLAIDKVSSDEHAEPYTILPCGHVFGFNCASKWLTSDNSCSCPCCRKNMYHRLCQHGVNLTPYKPARDGSNKIREAISESVLASGSEIPDTCRFCIAGFVDHKDIFPHRTEELTSGEVIAFTHHWLGEHTTMFESLAREYHANGAIDAFVDWVAHEFLGTTLNGSQIVMAIGKVASNVFARTTCECRVCRRARHTRVDGGAGRRVKLMHLGIVANAAMFAAASQQAQNLSLCHNLQERVFHSFGALRTEDFYINSHGDDNGADNDDDTEVADFHLVANGNNNGNDNGDGPAVIFAEDITYYGRVMLRYPSTLPPGVELVPSRVIN